MQGFDVTISGRKRYHGAARATLDFLSIADGRLKVEPLAGFSALDLSAYMNVARSSAHPLTEIGYFSIGCEPCTEPGGIGRPIRAPGVGLVRPRPNAASTGRITAGICSPALETGTLIRDSVAIDRTSGRHNLGAGMDSWIFDFLIFAAVGFFAQLIDGALGMGYGVISSTVLLATGVPPAHTSASVHAAKLFTTAASGMSAYRPRQCRPAHPDHPLRSPARSAAFVGAMVLVNVPAGAIRPYVFGYLGIMGLVIIWRGLMFPASKTIAGKFIAPLGTAGGFLDAIGGGGWGPVVTSSLIGAGASPRFVVGTVNAAEFVVTCAVVSAFAATIVFGVWQEAHGIMDHLMAVAGLVIGGVPAALLAGWLLQGCAAQAPDDRRRRADLRHRRL